MKTTLLKRSLQHPLQSRPSRCFPALHYLGLGMLAALLTTLPVRAAEKVTVLYGSLAESVQVSSLNTFAKDGTVNPELAFYFKLAKADLKTQQEFRQALTKRVNLDPILISRFFYSELGEDFLIRLGQYIQTPNQGNGVYALRSALILSALDSEGLSLLNFINKYPTNLNIDAKLALQGFKVLERTIKGTKFFTAKMGEFSANESAGSTVDYAALPDLRQRGSYKTQQQRWVLKDQSRDRQLYVIVVRPDPLPAQKIPVVIVSHGLGSKPEDFVDKAQQLASYGFVVAMPQHPGSDSEQVQKLRQGLSSAYFLTSDFTDRPKDISYLIDELERRNSTEFGGNLDLKSVGVAGHSFGGYTALAVAGATIDFENLQKACDRPFGHVDTSLLLQCRALQLPRQTYNFRDERVKAVFAANPVNYSVFGPRGLGQIQIPVFMAGGSYDLATPTALEQAQSFPLIGSSTKYLALAEGQPHVNLAKMDAGITRMLDSIPGLVLANPELIRSYADALILAFFKLHVAGDAQYQPYMQPAYAAYLSRDQQFKVFLMTQKSDAALEQAIADFKSKY